MKFSVLLAMTCLAGCSGATTEFVGSTGISIELNGSSYTVYRKDDQVEVVRTGFVWKPNIMSVADESVYAIEEVTGCRVADSSLIGDAAVQRARISC